jgi:hypothetical protein
VRTFLRTESSFKHYDTIFDVNQGYLFNLNMSHIFDKIFNPNNLNIPKENKEWKNRRNFKHLIYY